MSWIGLDDGEWEAALKRGRTSVADAILRNGKHSIYTTIDPRHTVVWVEHVHRGVLVVAWAEEGVSHYHHGNVTWYAFIPRESTTAGDDFAMNDDMRVGADAAAAVRTMLVDGIRTVEEQWRAHPWGGPARG